MGSMVFEVGSYSRLPARAIEPTNSVLQEAFSTYDILVNKP